MTIRRGLLGFLAVCMIASGVWARHGIVTHRDMRFEEKLDAPVSSVMTPQERLVTVRENAPKHEVLYVGKSAYYKDDV